MGGITDPYSVLRHLGTMMCNSTLFKQGGITSNGQNN